MNKDTYDYFLREIKNYNLRLGHIPLEYRTYELCFESVKVNGLSLLYVPLKHRTYKLCLEENPNFDNLEEWRKDFFIGVKISKLLKGDM